MQEAAFSRFDSRGTWEEITGFIVALIVGAVAGWLASLAMRAPSPRRRWLNIVAGTIGALLGAFVLGPQLGGGNILEAMLDPMTPVVALLGAVGLLALVSLLRRRR